MYRLFDASSIPILLEVWRAASQASLEHRELVEHHEHFKHPFEHPSWAFWKLWAFWTPWTFWALWTYYLLSSMGVLNIVSILNKNKKTVQNCYPLYIVVSWAFWKIAIMLNIWPFEHCDNFEHCDHFEHFTVWTSVHHRPTLPFGARQLLNFRWIQFKRRTELKANWAWGKERAEYCKER